MDLSRLLLVEAFCTIRGEDNHEERSVSHLDLEGLTGLVHLARHLQVMGPLNRKERKDYAL